MYRIFAAASLTLSAAVLWGQTQSQAVGSFFNGLPLKTMLIAAMCLFALSVAYVKVSWKMTILGIVISAWCFFLWLLPTI